jgi:DMSO/TMAO reductase YedYZ molybdopterin-dependent catalytic subunit
MNITDLIPRRAVGLPPGQRQLRVFPRFSDKPLQPPPDPSTIGLTISIEGVTVAELTAQDLDHYERVESTHDFHCVTTWSYRGLTWGGYRLAQIIDQLEGFESIPGYAVATAADNVSAVFLTEDLLAADVLVATHLDGEPLDGRHGAPLRLISPGQYGYKNVKHLVAIDFRGSQPPSAMGAKEHLRARVALEERHAKVPSRLIRVPYRLMVIPTTLAAERGMKRKPRSAPQGRKAATGR